MSTRLPFLKVWSITPVKGTQKKSYRFRWEVCGQEHERAFPRKVAAEAFRSELLRAEAERTEWDEITGLPIAEELGGEKMFAQAVREHALRNAPTLAPNTLARDVPVWAYLVTIAVKESTQKAPEGLVRYLTTQWLEKSALDPSGAACERYLLKHSLKLSELTKEKAGDLYVELGTIYKATATGEVVAEPASYNYANRRRTIYKAILSDLVERGELTAMPLPKETRTNKKRSAVKVEKEQSVNPEALLDDPSFDAMCTQLLKQCGRSGAAYVAYLKVLRGTGMRPSEALALIRADVISSDGQSTARITIRGNDVGSAGRYAPASGLGPIKGRGKSATRSVPANEEVMAIIEAVPEYEGCKWLFSVRGKNGERTRLSLGPIERAWNSARIEVFADGDPRRESRIYDLRHYCLTRWLAVKNFPPHIVAKWAGHDPAVLLGVYAHVMPTDEERWAVDA